MKLVEDNPINQLVAREFLKKMGLTLEIANHGGEAVEKAASTKFERS